MKNTIFFILLLSSFCSFGQIDSEIKSGAFKLDTINVKISVYQNRIETESYFENSKSKLKVIFIKTNNEFEKVVTRENCPFRPEDFWRSYVYGFENGKIVDEDERYYSSARVEGIAGHIDNEVRESYNKTLNSEFLKKYVVILFQKIKNYR